MPKKLTQEEFIYRAREIHDDKYDYSKVEYVNSSTKVCIICPIHGEFWQNSSHHLKGHGCKKCRDDKSRINNKGIRVNSRKKICDIAINDFNDVINGESKRIYYIWSAIIKRCYDKSDSRHSTYKDCKVCDEWLYFSNFHKWYIENYKVGWCLDKDILSGKEKIYSPDTCCFIPNEINTMFNRHQNKRGKSGVCGVQFFRGKYHAILSICGRNRHIGTFNTLEEAFDAYKKSKEQYIKSMANKWRNEINDNVYNAMIVYDVKIND